MPKVLMCWFCAIFAVLGGTSSLFALSTSASAAVIVGVPNAGNCYPFTCNDSGVSSGQSIQYTQIYSSAAFAAPLAIGSITFYDTLFPGPVISGDYSISFGTTTASLGAGYPINLSNVSPFFVGHLGSAIGSSFTITGNSFSYDPSAGNLVLQVIASNQANVPNGSGNGYFDADQTGATTTRAFLMTGHSAASDQIGLVTGFNVSTVPLPPSLPMFGAAIIGLVAFSLAGRRNPRPISN